MLDGWGILVPPRDGEALGRACAELLADPLERARIGRRGRERVLARFRSSMVVERYSGLYHELSEGAQPAVEAIPVPLPDVAGEIHLAA